MRGKSLKDEIVGVVMGFAPHSVSYILITEMDYRSSPRRLQVVDLRGR